MSRLTGMVFFTISIHALREEGDSTAPASIFDGSISIHALREEGDDKRFLRVVYSILEFLSTPSARRATTKNIVSGGYEDISIHALREEGDARRRSASRARP